MIVQTSRSATRVVGRLERGESLHEALVSTANAHAITAAQVSGVGILEEAELAIFDLDKRAFGPPRRFRGALHVVALNGNISLVEGAPVAVLQVALARETDRGLEVIGGQLVAARAFALEIVVDSWDDLVLERAVDGATGLPLWRMAAAPSEPSRNATRARSLSVQDTGGASLAAAAASAAAPPSSSSPPPASPPTPAPAPAAGLSVPSRASEGGGPPTLRERASAPPRERASAPPRTLSDVARALEAMPSRPASAEFEPGGLEPQPGDLLEHPSFGVVEVESEGDPGRLRIRLSTGSRREILLDVFEVVPRPQRDGKNVYALRPRRR